MGYSLEFAENSYAVKQLQVGDQRLTYRAYENIVYVAQPVDTQYQIMNLYIPEAYCQGKAIGNYTAGNAPIFLPNTVGGYMPGRPEAPGERCGQKNAAFVALSKGYVVAAPGARGRKLQSADGYNIGVAPACIVDLKAAVRYLRYNKSRLPAGDTEKIISNGTSAGGALSALLGATGNHADYEPYLQELGAADERDDILAASCYCPITNLEHADSAYEWTFRGIHEYTKMVRTREGDRPVHGQMNEQQCMLSAEVNKAFPAYVNGLGLIDSDGKRLYLDAAGEGSFKDLIGHHLKTSAQKALDGGGDWSAIDGITLSGETVADLDLDRYMQFITRMKPALAFDSVELDTPENELFGTSVVASSHFTGFSMKHSRKEGGLADPLIVKMMNPMNYIGRKESSVAPYWRIRHGASDRDTAPAIPVILATRLMNAQLAVDFALPWEQAHGGDYDLEELFAWMDQAGKAPLQGSDTRPV